MKNKEKLIMLASALNQPRVVKRITQKSNEYSMVYVLSFKRKVYENENFLELKKLPNVIIKNLGSFNDRKYLNRVLNYLKVLVFIYLNHGVKRKKLYVFGIDFRILSIFLINKKISYEISDIVWLYKSGVYRFILRQFDYYLTQKSDYIIFTSEAFWNKYYSFLERKKVRIVENMFKTYGKVNPIEDIYKNDISIAYVGAFRYPQIIKDLLFYVSNNQNIFLNFYGGGAVNIIETIQSYSTKYGNIKYLGTFTNPDDLEKIYAGNNINFVAYDNKLENERVAMPNKYYESIFFNIPLVCSENTFVGNEVLKNKIGWTISPDLKGIQDFFNKITMKEIIDKHDNIKKLDKNNFSEL